MAPCEPLYGVRVSSSGLIYAVIVGAWAAYLVPMWLRRQDELNEARPTERFSTAIRLLSGKAGMERRYAKDVERRQAQRTDDAEAADPEESSAPTVETPGARADAYAAEPTDPSVDVRAFANPRTMIGTPQADEERDPGGSFDDAVPRRPARAPSEPGRDARPAPRQGQAKRTSRAKRAKLLARRRRTTMCLFLAFTFGAIVAAVGGLAFLWVPAAPAVLLSAYIVYLRAQERRRFTFTMDRRQAEAAARQLHRTRKSTAEPTAVAEADAGAPRPSTEDAGDVPDPAVPERPREPRRPPPPASADRRALVEQTDHAEWIDQQRAARDREPTDGWDPVPVPLPTYVNAPVAPRASRDVDLDAPDAWSSARSTGPRAEDPAPEQEARPRDRRTPLFDQYAGEDDRPRAANE